MADWFFAMQKICNWQKKISALVSLRGPRRLTRVDIFFCIKPPYNRFILIVKSTTHIDHGGMWRNYAMLTL